MPRWTSGSNQARFGREVAAGGGIVLVLLALGLPVCAGDDPGGNAPDPRLIGLRAVGFIDPLLERPGPESPFSERAHSRPRGEEATRYVIVQFHHRVSAAERMLLSRSGGTVVGSLRRHAVVLGLPSGAAEEGLRADPGVRYVGPFLPAYKLDPALNRRLRDGEEGSAAIRAIDVELFPGEDPERLLGETAARFTGGEVRASFVRPQRPGRAARLSFQVSAEALAEAVGLFTGSSEVAWVRALSPLELYNDNAVWIGQTYDRVNGPLEAQASDPKPYAESAAFWSAGLTGAGQVVAVADTGLEYETCFWEDPGHPVSPQQVRPPGPLAVDPDHRKILALNGVNSFVLDHDGSFRHGTHVAATVAGDDLSHLASPGSVSHDHGDGIAPGAKIVFEDIGGPRDSTCEATLWVDSVGDLLEQEYQAGARISTNSWGGGIDRPDELDLAVWEHEDLLVIFSAGNSAAVAINDLATAKNSVAVGATENHDATFQHAFGPLDPENMTAFSSRGPATDGRVKPDVVAPGYRVYSNRFTTQYVSDELAPECSPGDPAIEVCFPDVGGCYRSLTDDTCAVGHLLGTSMAAPIVAGLGALARQYFTDGYHPAGVAVEGEGFEPSAALLKAVLLNGARNMTGHLYERRGASPQDLGPLADAPSNIQGWGRVVLDDALYLKGDSRRLELLDVPNAAGLASGQSEEIIFEVVATGQPLKLTLVWTDPPGLSYAATALVNDLDLVLEAPDGALYRGNQWTVDDVGVPDDKESSRDAPGRDSLNNVEGILIRAPEAGLYRARIEAFDVPGYQGVLRQGFALVVSGAVTRSPGAVAGGAGGPGAPLTLAKAPSGEIDLAWGASCLAVADDYEIYEGALGLFGLHTARLCSTGGEMSVTIAPAAGSAYYLVVPRSDAAEGSYGTDSEGIQRPRGGGACLPQSIADCP
jgi:hypothetical protein